MGAQTKCSATTVSRRVVIELNLAARVPKARILARMWSRAARGAIASASRLPARGRRWRLALMLAGGASSLLGCGVSRAGTRVSRSGCSLRSSRGRRPPADEERDVQALVALRGRARSVEHQPHVLPRNKRARCMFYADRSCRAERTRRSDAPGCSYPDAASRAKLDALAS